jgi:nicotinate-nucleotide adenylyltransferase
MSKIGLLFGSFNPIHNGHLAVARAAIDAGCSDVWMVVQARNPYKRQRDLPAFQHRKKMVELAVKPYNHIHVWETQQDPPHIVSTLLTLRSQDPRHQYVLLMGQDLVDSLPKWPDFIEVMAAAEIYCYPRIGGKAVGFTHRSVKPLNIQPINISSGLIRERLAETKAINGMTPLPVIKYIKDNKLYV